MDNNKDNNQMSPEELLEWLDKHASNSSDSSFTNSEFDEFEKDAIEGFINFTTPAKAKMMIEEINSSISEKVQPVSHTKRKTIIWISSAASVILIITLSIFLINKTKQETDHNIALNTTDITKDKAPAIPEKNVNESLAEENKPTESEINSLIKGKEQNYSKQENIESPKSLSDNKTTEPSEYKNLEGLANTNITVTSNTNLPDTKKSDLSNAISQDGNGIASGSTTKFSEAENQKKEYDKDIVADEVVAVSAKEEVSKGYYEKSSLNKNKNKAAKISEKANADSKVMPSIAQTATMAEPVNPGYINSGTDQMAFYPKGDEALKNYMLTVLKTKTIKGAFKIKATVTKQGILKTDSVEAIDKSNRVYEKEIKESLNNMSQWSPATKNGALVESKTNFTINL